MESEDIDYVYIWEIFRVGWRTYISRLDYHMFAVIIPGSGEVRWWGSQQELSRSSYLVVFGGRSKQGTYARKNRDRFSLQNGVEDHWNLCRFASNFLEIGKFLSLRFEAGSFSGACYGIAWYVHCSCEGEGNRPFEEDGSMIGRADVEAISFVGQDFAISGLKNWTLMSHWNCWWQHQCHQSFVYSNRSPFFVAHRYYPVKPRLEAGER